MPHAIARIAKLKSGNVGASEQHTKRERETLNADPKITNIRFIGQPDKSENRNLETIVRDRIGDQTIRKNGVLCVEMLLTASPEYFRPNDPSKAGYYKPERLADFRTAVHSWLDNEYGDRIVRAELHLDESTPHVHAYLVPLDERGKLNCRGIFGGRQKLSQFQDSYANALSPLGLERGIRGSRARHTTVKQYYAAVTKTPDLTLDQETIQHQLADRLRVIKEKEQALVTAKLLSRDNEALQQRLKQAEIKIKTQNRELTNWKNKYADIANQVRDLPLKDVVYELGLEPDPLDKHKWQNEHHIINITGSKFFDWKHSKGGGGAIDLVMHINECDYKQSVAWLGDRFGESATIEAADYKTREIIKTEPVPEFTPPVPEQSKWLSVRKYLTRTRKLPSSLVDSLHQQGLIYADKNHNAVFIRRALDEPKITGASLRGTAGDDNTFKGLAKGSKRNEGWFYFERGEQSKDPVRRVVLVESPIDAMSLAVLERTDSKKTLYLSTDGAGQVPTEYLKDIKDLVIAFDRDRSGREMAERVIEQLPDAVVKSPKAVDWNEELVNTFDWSNPNREKATKQQPQHKQNIDRGWSR
ncbi:plasmid recombination protein [Waterburya agarophytonicola K14]|uniref:Plasmid recombination protein n=1 Tax=Waterburya agarophytonicola KI4 TaxID=2874699 RepID=A0A964BU26_9CYAN|nr:MobV family relaxase [Waterburya agarophytonicola]MCC0178523.1 plasmid recombination protein [Waterburya agarophytonicola KI4]